MNTHTKTQTKKTLNCKERAERIKSSLIFCRKTGCYITHSEYLEYLESLIAY